MEWPYISAAHSVRRSLYSQSVATASTDLTMVMHFAACFSLLLHLAASAAPNLQHAFANPDNSSSTIYSIPTIRESATQARRVLNLSNIATLSTVFPSSSPSSLENRPDNLGGSAAGLMDYYASCGSQPYNPTILAISIATSFKNARAGSNVTLSLRYHPPSDHPPADDVYTYSPANLPRFSLIGHIEALSPSEIETDNVHKCFLRAHPDAEAWTPGNQIHASSWTKLVVEEVYWIGGFGDRAYIGWIPVDVWRGVTEHQVRNARLVGEDGWEGKAQPLEEL